MKRIVTLLFIVGLCQLTVCGQKKYEMVVEKTDGTEITVNLEDIVRTYFRERTEDVPSEGDFLTGEWHECTSLGVFLDDATEYEVMHLKFYPNKTADFWSVTKGVVDDDKYSFSYSYTLNGNTGTITMTVIASNYEPKVGDTETAPFTYVNGIFHIGEIYYKKLDGTGGGTGGGTDTNTYTSCPDSNHPHIIDLGLPSGTKWACCNLGASTPEDYGNYYAWGETSPKSVYSWDTYQYGSSKDNVVNIGSDIAGTGYDAATANCGAPWHMPTKAQCDELLTSCTSVWTTQNSVNGRKFTGPNGGTIFLPAAGYRWGSGLGLAGSYGYCWSSTLTESDPLGAWYLGFGPIGVGTYGYYRYYGLSVRPVR